MPESKKLARFLYIDKPYRAILQDTAKVKQKNENTKLFTKTFKTFRGYWLTREKQIMTEKKFKNIVDDSSLRFEIRTAYERARNSSYRVGNWSDYDYRYRLCVEQTIDGWKLTIWGTVGNIRYGSVELAPELGTKTIEGRWSEKKLERFVWFASNLLNWETLSSPEETPEAEAETEALPEGWENGKPAWEDEGLDIEALAKEYDEAPEEMKRFLDDMWDEETRAAVHKNLRKSVSYKVVDSENNPVFAGTYTLERAQEALDWLIRMGCKKNTPYQIVEA